MMVFVGFYERFPEALELEGGYRIESTYGGWHVYLDSPEEPIGWPISEPVREIQN